MVSLWGPAVYATLESKSAELWACLAVACHTVIVVCCSDKPVISLLAGYHPNSSMTLSIQRLMVWRWSIWERWRVITLNQYTSVNNSLKKWIKTYKTMAGLIRPRWWVQRFFPDVRQLMCLFLLPCCWIWMFRWQPLPSVANNYSPTDQFSSANLYLELFYHLYLSHFTLLDFKGSNGNS